MFAFNNDPAIKAYVLLAMQDAENKLKYLCHPTTNDANKVWTGMTDLLACSQFTGATVRTEPEKHLGLSLKFMRWLSAMLYTGQGCHPHYTAFSLVEALPVGMSMDDWSRKLRIDQLDRLYATVSARHAECLKNYSEREAFDEAYGCLLAALNIEILRLKMPSKRLSKIWEKARKHRFEADYADQIFNLASEALVNEENYIGVYKLFQIHKEFRKGYPWRDQEANAHFRTCCTTQEGTAS